ncbi:MAG: GIY-YIG nuclease family protein [Methanobacteriaceae archaeon]
MKGTYCLIIYVSQETEISVGALTSITFESGYYVYIGSAMNSLIPRIKRHLRDDKKLHWHIDYLLLNENSSIEEIIFTDSEKRIECKLANLIKESAKSANISTTNIITNIIDSKISQNEKCIVANFGCSDCNCESHLIYFENKEEIIGKTISAFEKLDVNYYNLEYFNEIS